MTSSLFPAIQHVCARCIDVVHQVQRDVSVRFGFASTDSLRTALSFGCRALHFSGHGHESCLNFEDGRSGLQLVTVNTLRDLLSAGGVGASSLDFVFVSACHSRSVGQVHAAPGYPAHRPPPPGSLSLSDASPWPLPGAGTRCAGLPRAPTTSPWLSLSLTHTHSLTPPPGRSLSRAGVRRRRGQARGLRARGRDDPGLVRHGLHTRLLLGLAVRPGAPSPINGSPYLGRYLFFSSPYLIPCLCCPARCAEPYKHHFIPSPFFYPVVMCFHVLRADGAGGLLHRAGGAESVSVHRRLDPRRRKIHPAAGRLRSPSPPRRGVFTVHTPNLTPLCETLC